MRADLALRGMSVATIDNYVRCARKFAEHFGRSPCTMGLREARAFLLHLTGRGLHPSSLSVYGSALRFLYDVTLDRPFELERLPRPRVPMRVPVVPSGTEVERLLGAVSRPNHRVALMLAYGVGLRVGEICRLRVDDIDAKRMVLRIRNAKRGRERHVMLSARLLRELRAYWKARSRRRDGSTSVSSDSCRCTTGTPDFTPRATRRPASSRRDIASRPQRQHPNARRPPKRASTGASFSCVSRASTCGSIHR